MDEILPVGCAKDEAHSSIMAQDVVGAKVAPSGSPQQSLKLIDGQHTGGRIINCRRKRLDCDVDKNSKSEQRVLLQGSFGTENNRPAQYPLINSTGIPIEKEQRLIPAQEIADLRCEFDDAVRFLRFGYEPRCIYRGYDRRSAVIKNCSFD